MTKTYRGRTFTEVFQRIKEELGPDAVILQQQELKRSSNPSEKVEVLVTLDDISEAPPLAPNGTQAIGTYNNKGVKPVEWRNMDDERAISLGGRPAAKKAPPPEKNPMSGSVDKLTSYMESTLAEVQKLREEFAMTRSDFLSGIRANRNGIPKEFSPIASELSKNGLPSEVVQDLLAEAMLLCANSRDEISIKDQMKVVLENRISVAPRSRLRKGRPLVQMFIGPPGSGKSGTISKLAGRATITGNPNVAIVTTDCYRMGALEQMAAFASAAEIDLEKISSPDEVPEVFERLREKSLVLVDTAGRSLKNEEHEEEITALYEAIRPDEVHLVLPLNMRDRDMEKAVEAYKALKANRVVFTKQDESSEQGALLWLPIKFEIPLSYIGNGQGPDNIISAEKDIIVSWLLR
jgi:flagellar biosynthesis protein FlhF